MKKLLLKFVIGLFIILIGFMVFQILNKENEIKVYKNNAKRLPKTNKIEWVETPKINHHKSVLLLFFHPECEHCTYEASLISQNPSLLEKAQVWWISFADKPSIIKFSKTYKLNHLPNFYFGKIPIELVKPTFGSITVPHIFIYNNKQILVKEFKGETKLEAIVKYL